LVSEVLYFPKTPRDKQRKAAGFGRNRLTWSWRGHLSVSFGGASGENDLAQGVAAPIQEGMESLQAIQDAYSPDAVNAAWVGVVDR
jgi:hypothetical protein